MSVVFCKICNNILDINKTKLKKATSEDSGSESHNLVDYEYIINQLAIDIIPPPKEMNNVDFITLQQHPKFKEKSKKEKKTIKKNIESLLETSEKDKELLNIYFVCQSCSYSEKIKEKQLIMVRSRETDSHHEEHPIYRWKNLFFSKILPHTREYICKNKECPTHNGVQRSAKFSREPNSTSTLYFCEICNEVWKISIK